MKKNYTKPEIEVSRYDVVDAAMAQDLSAWYFTTGGTGENNVDALQIVSYTDIFKSN